MEKDISSAKTWDEVYGEGANALEAHTEAKAFIPDMDDDQLRKLAREKLSMALQAIDPVKQPELTKKLSAEVKDRLDGKPAQSITSTVHSTVAMLVANVKTDDMLLARIKQDLLDGKLAINS